jgi:peptidoglycan/xylan/chitin deacetylase (PgdA/CDA1 family)
MAEPMIKKLKAARARSSALTSSMGLVLGILLFSPLIGGVPPRGATDPSPKRTPFNMPGQQKLIALTFDDGPRPFVLFGTRDAGGVSSPSLLGLLDREGVKATFFVMGWRLAESAKRDCRKIDVGVDCRQAAEEEHRRGHEIENHTFGHGDFRRMSRRYGEAWILNDIDKASRVIQAVTGERPEYVRPPDWTIWPELQERIQARGYFVMTKLAGHGPIDFVRQDVDSQDYLYWQSKSLKPADPLLHHYVMQRIEQRERRGIYDHVLVFHELPLSVQVLSTLIPELKSRGYRFVLLHDYMKSMSAGSP